MEPSTANVHIAPRTGRLGVLTLAAALLIGGVAPARAQIADRLLPTALGGAAGLAAGGFITMGVIVAKARAGHYTESTRDVLGWESVPVLVGIGAGATLGALDERRLRGSVYYGAGGFALGWGIGWLVGGRVWEPPEGKWAGAAIGGAAGLAIGGIAGMIFPPGGGGGGSTPAAAAARVPIGIRIRF